MNRIQITPAWRFQNIAGDELNPAIFTLLSAIHQHGNLVKASEVSGISYRHGWNLLRQWGDFFGAELVTKQRGKGASLTPLGEKLIWAQQRIDARLRPQLDSLASELSIELNKTLHEQDPLITIYASHGYAVALLPESLNTLQVNLQYMSGNLAVKALLTQESDITGIHIPSDPQHWSSLCKKMIKQLSNKNFHVMPLAERQQGLMVKAGNPLDISGLNDLDNNQLRFINRQSESGTRSLLEHLLKQHKVNHKNIVGYQTEEFTHSAVAAYVASGMADCGFGVEAAASQFGLDFIPITRERYLFISAPQKLPHRTLDLLRKALNASLISDKINALPGYLSITSATPLLFDDYLTSFHRTS